MFVSLPTRVVQTCPALGVMATGQVGRWGIRLLRAWATCATDALNSFPWMLHVSKMLLGTVGLSVPIKFRRLEDLPSLLFLR